MNQLDPLERARALFAGLADKHGLKIEWDEGMEPGVHCKLPRQDGLPFEVSMSIWDDELMLVHDWFVVDLFPTDREQVWSDFERFADGLLSGEARAVIRHCGDPERSYMTRAEICEDGEWRSVSTGLAPWRWRPWGRRTEVVRNSA